MGERKPRVTATQVIAALKRGGRLQIRTTGDHIHLRHPERGDLVTVPYHVGETLSPKLLQSILAQADIPVEELKELL